MKQFFLYSIFLLVLLHLPQARSAKCVVFFKQNTKSNTFNNLSTDYFHKIKSETKDQTAKDLYNSLYNNGLAQHSEMLISNAIKDNRISEHKLEQLSVDLINLNEAAPRYPNRRFVTRTWLRFKDYLKESSEENLKKVLAVRIQQIILKDDLRKQFEANNISIENTAYSSYKTFLRRTVSYRELFYSVLGNAISIHFFQFPYIPDIAVSKFRDFEPEVLNAYRDGGIDKAYNLAINEIKNHDNLIKRGVSQLGLKLKKPAYNLSKVTAVLLLSLVTWYGPQGLYKATTYGNHVYSNLTSESPREFILESIEVGSPIYNRWAKEIFYEEYGFMPDLKFTATELEQRKAELPKELRYTVDINDNLVVRKIWNAYKVEVLYEFWAENVFSQRDVRAPDLSLKESDRQEFSEYIQSMNEYNKDAYSK